MSACDGLYVAFNVVASGVNNPVPDVLQVAEVEAPLIVPLNESVLLLQITWSPPALTIATGFILINKESFTEEQSPTGSFVVRKTQTPPAETSLEFTL